VLRGRIEFVGLARLFGGLAAIMNLLAWTFVGPGLCRSRLVGRSGAGRRMMQGIEVGVERMRWRMSALDPDYFDFRRSLVGTCFVVLE
jgi:hypothetical protein